MIQRDEEVAKLLREHPFHAVKFQDFVEELVKQKPLPGTSSEPEVAIQEVSASLERVLASQDWKNSVTVQVKLTDIPHNPYTGPIDSDTHNPTFYAAHLTALVWVGLQRLVTHEFRDFGWTELLERLRSFPLIQGLFSRATVEMINNCLVQLHQEGSIVYKRIIAVPQAEEATVG